MRHDQDGGQTHEDPPNATITYTPFSGGGFNEIDFLGDNSMYLHAFDDDLTAGPWEAGNTILLQPVYQGTAYGADITYSFDFSAPSSALTDTMIDTWGEPKSLRWYDAGECAERVSWREMNWRIEDWFRYNFVDDILEKASGVACEGDHFGNTSFSIILGDDPDDDMFRYSFTWTPVMDAEELNECVVLVFCTEPTFCEVCLDAQEDIGEDDVVKITFTGAIRASSGVLTFVLDSIDETSVNMVHSEKLREVAENPGCGIEATFNRVLPEMFAWRPDRTGFDKEDCDQGTDDGACASVLQSDFDNAFGASAVTVGADNGLCLAETWQTPVLDDEPGVCAFVPTVHRLNYTPGWLELVYTETAGQNFEPVYLADETAASSPSGNLCFGGPNDTSVVDPTGPTEVKVEAGSGYMLLGGGTWAPYFEPDACVYPEPLFNDFVCP